MFSSACASAPIHREYLEALYRAEETGRPTGPECRMVPSPPPPPPKGCANPPLAPLKHVQKSASRRSCLEPFPSGLRHSVDPKNEFELVAIVEVPSQPSPQPATVPGLSRA
eukprot:8371518-Pyramimonas_sp.AAC.1